MLISLIVAMEQSRGIGRAGKLPWHLRVDLQRFKQLTTGYHLILGRKTWESIGRPLPGRKIIVISRNAAYSAPGCRLASSLLDALHLAEEAGDNETFIGGGSQIFSLALPLAQRIYLTQVHASIPCDVFFPEFDPAAWLLTSQQAHPADPENEFPFSFYTFERAAR
jgi:dihydrofolate reductase